jgi:hypothetical protein
MYHRKRLLIIMLNSSCFGIKREDWIKLLMFMTGSTRRCSPRISFPRGPLQKTSQTWTYQMATFARHSFVLVGSWSHRWSNSRSILDLRGLSGDTHSVLLASNPGPPPIVVAYSSNSIDERLKIRCCSRIVQTNDSKERKTRKALMLYKRWANNRESRGQLA